MIKVGKPYYPGLFFGLNRYLKTIISEMKAFRQALVRVRMETNLMGHVDKISPFGTDATRKFHCIINELM